MMDFGFPITEYRVYRWSGDDTPELLRILDASHTSYNDTDVMLGRGYSYHVTAVNLKGESHPSVPLDAKVMVPPGPPTSVVALATEHFVKLTWTPPVFDGASPILAYRVYVVADDGGATCIGGQNVADVADVQLAFLHDVPYDGTVRTYYVTAVNGEGESGPSDEASTQVYEVPSAPEGLSITWSDGRLSLEWGSPRSDGGTPVLSMHLYRRAEGEGFLSHLEELPWGTFGFEDVTVENGVEYTYAVSCSNLIGEGPMSGTVSAIPAGLPDPPSEVTAQGSDGSVLVSWGPPAWDGGRPVTGYRVFVVIDGPTPQMLAELDADVTEFMDDDLVNGRVYMYAVTALTTVGASQLSGMVEARPMGPPTEPLGLEAFWMGDHVLLTWDAPEDDGGSSITGYMVHREDQDPGNMTMLNALTFMDFDVEPDTEYNYTMYAFNSAGEGPMARVTFIVPKEEEPPVEPEAVEWTYMVLLVVLLALAVALLYMGLRGRTPS